MQNYTAKRRHHTAYLILQSTGGYRAKVTLNITRSDASNSTSGGRKRSRPEQPGMTTLAGVRTGGEARSNVARLAGYCEANTERSL